MNQKYTEKEVEEVLKVKEWTPPPPPKEETEQDRNPMQWPFPINRPK